MKWQQISKRQLEITFESGTKVLMIDRLPTAAIVQRPNTPTQVLQTRRLLDEEAKKLINMWCGNQPSRVILVNDEDINRIVAEEDKK